MKALNVPPSIKSYSRASTAEILDCSERHVDRLIERGKLKAYSVGARGIRITEFSIRELIDLGQIVAKGDAHA